MAVHLKFHEGSTRDERHKTGEIRRRRHESASASGRHGSSFRSRPRQSRPSRSGLPRGRWPRRHHLLPFIRGLAGPAVSGRCLGARSALGGRRRRQPVPAHNQAIALVASRKPSRLDGSLPSRPARLGTMGSLVGRRRRCLACSRPAWPDGRRASCQIALRAGLRQSRDLSSKRARQSACRLLFGGSWQVRAASRPPSRALSPLTRPTPPSLSGDSSRPGSCWSGIARRGGRPTHEAHARHSASCRDPEDMSAGPLSRRPRARIEASSSWRLRLRNPGWPTSTWSSWDSGTSNASESIRTALVLLGACTCLRPCSPDELLGWVAGADVDAMALQHSSLNHWLCTPNKLWESLAAGVPVVVSDFPVMRKIVLSGPSGPPWGRLRPGRSGVDRRGDPLDH